MSHSGQIYTLSQWFLNLIANQNCKTGSPSLVWQKIQEPLTMDNYALHLRVLSSYGKPFPDLTEHSRLKNP